MQKFLVLFVGLLCIVNIQQAQERQITGTVTDKEGVPVPGAAVLVEGTTKGTITDFDGNYILSVPAEAEYLVFSFLGMKQQRVEIGENTNINIILEPEDVGLEEVVVTAMGVKRKDKTIGYSYTKIDAAEATQKSEPDLLKSLQGKVAGVDISGSSGTPGSATRITIRGNSSFLGNNQPLIVVDGIPYSNNQYETSDQLTSGGAYSSGIATIDPNNIESITVLKGAGAAGLYGSRAAHGVILITTKTGTGNKPEKKFRATVNSSLAFEQISNLPEYQNTYGAGANFKYSNTNGSWGPRFDALDSVPLWPAYQDSFPGMPQMVPYQAYPDNVKNLFDNGVVLENSINVAGGNDKYTLTGNASMLDHKGFIPNSFFNKYNVDAGGTYNFKFGLKLGANFSYTSGEQRGGLFGAALAQDEGQASSFANTMVLARNWDMSLPYETPGNQSSVFHIGNQADNPLWSWQHNGVLATMERLIYGVNLGMEINSWLSVDYSAGVNKLEDNRLQIIDIGSRAYQGKGAITNDNIVFEELESNFKINISKVINDNYIFRAVVGHNVNQQTYDRTKKFGLEFIEEDELSLTNTKDTIHEPFYERKRLIGVYSALSLDYKTWLFINLTLRNDWSSTLPKSSRSYFYPSADVSLLFTDALKIESNFLTMGKLKASFSRVGNDADPYKLHNIYLQNLDRNLRIIGSLSDNELPFRGQDGITTSDVFYDPNLSPEFTTEIETGAILDFFNGRAGIDFTYYNRTSTNQLAPVSIPSATGYQQMYTNFGEINNQGIELGLNLEPINIENGLYWNIYSTFSKNKNEVVSLNASVERIFVRSAAEGAVSSVLEPGQPYGILRGTVSARDGEGNLLIDPSTGLLITATDQQNIGNPNPDFLLGISNTFKYKGFGLSFVIDYRQGGDIFSYTVQSYLGRGVTKDTEDREKSWVISGYYGDPDTGEPILDESGQKIINTTQVSTNDLYFGNSFALGGADEWSVYDATNVRLRELTLSYELPEKLMKKLPLTGLMVSLTGRNLWYYAPGFPKYTNFDPEVNSLGASNAQGIEYNTAPSAKRYGVNLKLTF